MWNRSLCGSKGSVKALSGILVAVDGSTYADNAFESAAELAKKFGSKLYAICVVHTPSMPGVDKETMRALTGQLQIEARLTLSRYHTLARSKYGIEIETILALGYPSRIIVDTAKAKDVDLIVVGSRGLSGIKGLLLGSVSHYVVRNAKGPVLVVR
jgi:nucleotide-binding universal stress UspA family protein